MLNLIQKKILEDRAIKILKFINISNYKLQAIQIKVALITKNLIKFLI